MTSKRSIKAITRTLATDAGRFGYAPPHDAGREAWAHAADAAARHFEAWYAVQPSAADAFARVVADYAAHLDSWRSPSGRPFPDWVADCADDAARTILAAYGRGGAA